MFWWGGVVVCWGGGLVCQNVGMGIRVFVGDEGVCGSVSGSVGGVGVVLCREAKGMSPAWCDAAVVVFESGRVDVDDLVRVKGLSYTKPGLRDRLKRRIMAGSKGGAAGQWSARKAQLLAQEYRRAGGGYRGSKGKGQRSLDKWTSEKWRTSDGKRARRRGGTARYLPEKAWRRLSTGEREATNRKKREASRRGRQFVSNTRRAREVGRDARKGGDDEARGGLVDGVTGGRREPVTGDRKPKRPKGYRY